MLIYIVDQSSRKTGLIHYESLENSRNMWLEILSTAIGNTSLSYLREDCHPEEAPRADEGSTAASDHPRAICTC